MKIVIIKILILVTVTNKNRVKIVKQLNNLRQIKKIREMELKGI